MIKKPAPAFECWMQSGIIQLIVTKRQTGYMDDVRTDQEGDRVQENVAITVKQ